MLFNLANINLKRSNGLKAINYFQKIIAIDSVNFIVYKQLGSLYAAKLDTVNAVKNLEKANLINGDDADVASELSLFLAFKKQDKRALNILNHALAADTTNIFLLRTLMKLNYSMSRYTETIKICEALLVLGNISAEIYNMEGSSYFELKKYECCIDAFDKLSANLQTERIMYLMGISYKKLKDYPNAIIYLNLTVQLSISANTYAYYNEIADTYQTIHQSKNVALNYQKSLFFAETPIAYYTLAGLYDEQLKDKKNAIKYYKKYLATKPPAKQKQFVEYVQSRINILAAK